MKRCGLALRNLAHFSEHLAGTGKVETALRPQLSERRQHVVSSVNVRVHRRETIGKTLRHETLSCEVVALVEVVTTDDMENARIAFQACGVQDDLVQKVSNPFRSPLRCFQRNAPHQPVDLVASLEQLFRQITAVLTRDAGDESFFCHFKIQSTEC